MPRGALKKVREFYFLFYFLFLFIYFLIFIHLCFFLHFLRCKWITFIMTTQSIKSVEDSF